MADIMVLTAPRRPPLFQSASHACVELARYDVALLQRFIESNPEYYQSVNGRPPAPRQAREEFDFELPADWTYDRKWVLAFTQPDGAMIGMAGLISDLFAPGVWHIGLYVIATTLHGTGVAYRIYNDLETWMRKRGARWLRLGVVEGNARAERFWERLGYIQVRSRLGIEMGERINTVRVMVKPLRSADLQEYLQRVARDRPDAVGRIDHT